MTPLTQYGRMAEKHWREHRPKMVRELGTFTMGDTIDQLPDALPVDGVKMLEFYMDLTPVRFADWRMIVQYGTADGFIDLPPGAGKKANHPVQQVN
jgi:formylglycine-generating enzyme required for sulfatase activity